jgi:preprotein translocase subunit SecA
MIRPVTRSLHTLFRPLVRTFGGAAKASRFERGSIAQLVGEVRRWTATLKDEDDRRLSERAEQLRRQPPPVAGEHHRLVQAIGLASEALRRTHTIELYDSQLLAGLVMSRGAVAEMETGEGKTFAGFLATFVASLASRGVHVCTPNRYLAARDHRCLAPALRRLGCTVALRDEADSIAQIQRAHQADITYGVGTLFGFDYLRDQWTLRTARIAPLGQLTTTRLLGKSPESQLLCRELYAAVIDEADQVLIDDAVSPLIITGQSDLPATDTALHHCARECALNFVAGDDFVIVSGRQQLQLTERGFECAYEDERLATDPNLQRPWHDYVVVALNAQHMLIRDRHYIVRDGNVQLVEATTGRIFSDRTWSGGLHQAVQAKEGLPITSGGESQGRMTRQAFFRRYQHLCGMTGTAASCEGEFETVYDLAVHRVPSRIPSRRCVLPPQVCSGRRTKLLALINEIRQMTSAGRPVLIGTNHIEQSRLIAESLHDSQIDCQLLNGVQDESEADIVRAAGFPAKVTVATHLAGRGTDIPLAESVLSAGGLHVIGWEHHRLSRVDRQLIGRGARQGDPGTARFYVCPDDEIVRQHAPHLARTVLRAVKSVEAREVLCRRIRAVQCQLAESDRRARRQLMNHYRGNLSRSAGEAFSSRGTTPHQTRNRNSTANLTAIR